MRHTLGLGLDEHEHRAMPLSCRGTFNTRLRWPLFVLIHFTPLETFMLTYTIYNVNIHHIAHKHGPS